MFGVVQQVATTSGASGQCAVRWLLLPYHIRYGAVYSVHEVLITKVIDLHNHMTYNI